MDMSDLGGVPKDILRRYSYLKWPLNSKENCVLVMSFFFKHVIIKNNK